MTANISSPQLRQKLDELMVVITALTQELATLKALVVTGNATVGGTLDVTGATTLDGGAVTYGANDSESVGFRNVRVPNV